MGRKRKRHKRKKNKGGDSPKDLPYEILSDILSRLSVRSLVGCRCVSKYWCSIMSDQSFVDSHFARSRDRPGTRTLLVSLSTYLKPGLSFFTTDHQDGAANPVDFLNRPDLAISKVSESLNGIIFLEHNDSISACNPSTREIIRLPTPTQDQGSGIVSSAANMLSFFSFGFDPATSQYKILRTWVKGFVTLHEILTLGDGSWRPVKPNSSIEIPREESVCVNGAVHFRTIDLSGNTVMMAFDLITEEFRTIPLPEPASILGHKSTIMKIKDSLAVLDYEQLLDFSAMKMWILDDYRNQTWREQEITLPFQWEELRGNCASFLISTIYTGEIVLAPRVVGNPMFLFLYDMERNDLRKVELPGSPESICQSAGPYFIKIAPIDCVETILSPREFRFE